MEKNIQCLLLKNNLVLVSQVAEVPESNIGEPDCILTKPYLLSDEGNLTTWMGYTETSEVLIRSDDVLTFVEPNSKIIDKYLEKIN
jgi:hypothetical protein